MKFSNKFDAGLYLLIAGIFLFLTVLIIISLHFLENLVIEPIKIQCSVWEDGVKYPNEPFNCYCPAGDSAIYMNLKDIRNCNGDYYHTISDVGNYINER